MDETKETPAVSYDTMSAVELEEKKLTDTFSPVEIGVLIASDEVYVPLEDMGIVLLKEAVVPDHFVETLENHLNNFNDVETAKNIIGEGLLSFTDPVNLLETMVAVSDKVFAEQLYLHIDSEVSNPDSLVSLCSVVAGLDDG